MTRLLLVVPLLAPLVACVVAWLLAGGQLRRTRTAAWFTVGAAAAILTDGLVAGTVLVQGGRSALTFGSLFRLDALSAVMVIVIGAVGVIATWASVGFIEQEVTSGEVSAHDIRRYATLVPAFLAAMVLAVSVNNLGVLWASVEATTIVTAFLVGHRRGRGAVEAAWKYVMICSVGIGLAYLGTVFIYFAARHTTIPAGSALDWTQLAAHSDQLDPGVVRVAFALLVLGFGTKAGMAPLHSWLPDAHSQAPAPVSALMSGVLLPVAAYALMRYRVIALGSLDATFVRSLLLVIALTSLVIAASLIIAQRDYKRLLAYSSIEHMALVVIGLAVGTPLAIAAVLLHIVGHGLAKAVLFCGAGQILLAEKTSQIAAVRGLLSRRAPLAACFGVGFLALLGLPPFSLFESELGLARAAGAEGMGWVIAVALALLVVIFVAIAVHVVPMLLGSPDDDAPALTPAARPELASVGPVAPLILGLAALAVLGVVAWPLDQLLHTASLIGGSS